jgi:phage terminase large subunit GpA-like protein
MSESLINQLQDLIKAGEVEISTIKPSEWTEQNVVMGKPRPGLFRYNYTPYTREIIDCLDPNHPARKIAVMKGAQSGYSSGVIMPFLGYMIKHNPGNTYLMVGAPDLVDKSVEKLDLMIDGAGLRPYIKPQVMRNRANKSGDTNKKKDFSGGYIFIGSSNNHKAIAQVDLQYIILDDLDAMKGQSEESGNFLDLIAQRSAAYKDSYKMLLVSTPLLKGTSLIEPEFLKGDQRKYFISCPCCGERIILKWSVKEGDIINPLLEDVALKDGGIKYELNEQKQVINSSVGYVCYKCEGFFKDKEKFKLLNEGVWIPTATPINDTFYSYHLPSLYAPIGMFDWAHYAGKYAEAHQEGQPRNESKYKTLCNVCFGETYEEQTQAIKANALQQNIRPYEVGIIPEKLSIADGNGKIVLLTLACDLNGVEDDARLDWEIVAWSESGSTYSINHGSIGTFIPRENSLVVKEDRERWTYRHGVEKSVWGELEKLISKTTYYQTDTGRNMIVFAAGVDTGYMDKYAWQFIDNSHLFVYGLKGKNTDTYMKLDADKRLFQIGRERSKLYIVEGNLIKDDVAELISLNWQKGTVQPFGYMNYPTPSGGKYLYTNFFSHYEAEHKQAHTNSDGQVVGFRWVKKDSSVQNHLWDCRIYNIVVKEILVWQVLKSQKVLNPTWKDFVELALKATA